MDMAHCCNAVHSGQRNIRIQEFFSYCNNPYNELDIARMRDTCSILDAAYSRPQSRGACGNRFKSRWICRNYRMVPFSLQDYISRYNRDFCARADRCYPPDNTRHIGFSDLFLRISATQNKRISYTKLKTNALNKKRVLQQFAGGLSFLLFFYFIQSIDSRSKL